jgi:hypothetical protein
LIAHDRQPKEQARLFCKKKQKIFIRLGRGEASDVSQIKQQFF